MKRFIAWLTYKPEPVDEIRRRAMRYLVTHSSVTVYEFIGGHEFDRRPRLSMGSRTITDGPLWRDTDRDE